MKEHGGERWSVVRRATRRVRAAAMASVLLVAVTAVPVLLLVGWLVGDRWGFRSAAPLVLVAIMAAAVVALVVVLLRRWVNSLTEATVAAAAERRRGLPEGSLRGVMELGRGLPAGVSASLFHRTEREVTKRLEGASPAELAGDVGERVRGRGMAVLAAAGMLALVALVAGFAAPERARAGWAPLFHPVAHLRGPVLPALAVRPGDVEVARGAMLSLVVDAPLRTHVTVEWRVAGGLLQTTRMPVADGRAGAEIGPVDAAMEYRVRAPDGAASRLYTARPVDPLMLAGFAVEVVYPEHVGRAPERFDGEPPALAVPAGTILKLRGRATRTLGTAAMRRADGAERPITTTGTTLAMDWRIASAEAGRWELHLRGEDGATSSGAAIELQVAGDGPPRVRILAPGRDTVLTPSRRQPLLIEAADDHGLIAATLVVQRVGARGERGTPVRTPLGVEQGADRALIRTVLDASEQPLSPGDAVEYHVEVVDNSPSGQVGRSAAYLLREPGRAELRERARAEARDLSREAERAAERARSLDRATRDLSRQAAAQRGGGQGSPGSERSPGAEAVDFQRASEARALAAAHEEALSELEALRERAERLQETLRRAGLLDADLERRLEQLRDLYARLDRPETRNRLEALRDAADALDREALAAQLEQLAASPDVMRQRLEESLALLEQAVLDQEMKALAREAEEIAAHQEVLAAAMRRELGAEGAAAGDAGRPTEAAEPGAAPRQEAPANPTAAPEGQDGRRDGSQAGDGAEGDGADAGERRAAQQDELAERTQRLNDLLGALQRQLMSKGDEESASQAGAAQEQGQSAQESMEEAADKARQGQGDGAAESAERAAGELASAARSLDDARGRMGDAGREQAREAVRQAAQDALRLAEREEALRRQMEESARQGGGEGSGDSGAELRQLQSEQMAVQQGLEQLGRNLSESTRQSGLLNEEVSRALARAMLDMDQAAAALRAGGPMPTGAAERSVQSLNRLAMALLQNDMESRQASRPGHGPGAPALAELAREQNALNAQVGAFAPLDVSAASAADQMEQLAEHQRGIARRVGEVSGLLGGREDVLGQLDQLSIEADGLAAALAGGRIDPEVRARQERLFHRLLDAGRTLEREEYSEERVGERAERRAAAELEALDPALLEAVLRYPGPDAAQLQGMPPALRRLVLEYFDRLNHGDRRAPAPGDGGAR
jgi:hypothetical protein